MSKRLSLGVAQRQFMALVNAALWNRPIDNAMFADCRWDDVLRIAREQTMEGIVMDGMEMLPTELMPPLVTKLRMIGVVQRLEQRNLHVDMAMAAVARAFVDRGIRVVFFKGQIAANRYPKPLHRQPGDVDFIADNPRLAGRVLAELAGSEGNDNPKHFSVAYDGIVWESHKMILDMSFPPSQRYVDRLVDGMFHGRLQTECVNGEELPCLDATFEVMHCTAHINHHFLHIGLGMRQLADFVMLVHKRNKQVDRQLLDKYLRGVHLVRFFRAMLAMGVDFLGLPQEDCMYAVGDADHRNGRLILRTAMSVGNFGRYDGKDKSNAYRELLWSVCNSFRFFRMCPVEALFRPTMIPRVWLQVHLHLSR